LYSQEELLSKKLGEMLVSRDLTVALAESCTGGLVMKYLSDIPGSSRYLLGGVVSYSDELKIKLLGVPREIIRDYGAVSKPTAELMAEGVKRITGATIGLGITGIAGPEGATETKVVGLVYIALCSVQGLWSQKFIFPGERSEVRLSAAQAALEILQQHLLGLF